MSRVSSRSPTTSRITPKNKTRMRTVHILTDWFGAFPVSSKVIIGKHGACRYPPPRALRRNRPDGRGVLRQPPDLDGGGTGGILPRQGYPLPRYGGQRRHPAGGFGGQLPLFQARAVRRRGTHPDYAGGGRSA